MGVVCVLGVPVSRFQSSRDPHTQTHRDPTSSSHPEGELVSASHLCTASSFSFTHSLTESLLSHKLIN